MKPSRFSYHRPHTVDEATRLLADTGQHGKVLAGGQSLIPLMNMRLAAPEHIIDINHLTDLDDIAVTSDGVVVEALVRHSRLAADDAAHAAQPLLRKALQLVAHPAIRNRGTTVGSIVHADPSAEMPAVLLLTGGSIQARSTAGERDIAAADFFVGPMESALRPDELAVSATFGTAPDRAGTAIRETTRRHGDYALAGVAVIITVDAEGAIQTARAAYFSVADTPQLVDLEAVLRGVNVRSGVELQSVADFATAGVEPTADIHATADYRAHLARTLTVRALSDAMEEVRDA
ncbi:carbon-monoxide dehydrogenase medium subunit [Antricoccus suffuscus]|uniref:Carbon-monoxide dehydrogenase medium subunit n=1 Tax=Antricoccus suffuscus TaxID=1629062 RepID=A0A2T0ZVJ0_9ACTN|nr:xanthine dehydrogenase family protein subunit M [Antricoccus suffuscus]PRZ40375.1 carbon-monoxide dehydrogenase medium subunit [Antricoccus suffuscus]